MANFLCMKKKEANRIDWWALAKAATANTRIRSIERKIARIEKEKQEVVRLQDVV